jgi:hypothetical protein
MKSIEDQKRELLERSQRCREALAADCGEVAASLGWVPKTLQILRSISPLLLVSAPLIGWFARKKLRNGKARAPQTDQDKKKKAGLLALAWQGFRVYKQMAPFVQGFMKAWPKTRPPRERATHIERRTP